MKQHHKLFDLTGRTIVVAGGAGQIGFAFCSILADAGASVILADIDTEMAKKNGAGLAPDLAEKITIAALDVSTQASVAAFFQAIAFYRWQPLRTHKLFPL